VLRKCPLREEIVVRPTEVPHHTPFRHHRANDNSATSKTLHMASAALAHYFELSRIEIQLLRKRGNGSTGAVLVLGTLVASLGTKDKVGGSQYFGNRCLDMFPT
jgi:hypothetical protein